jgi:hypothetical protein
LTAHNALRAALAWHIAVQQHHGGSRLADAV